MTKSKILSLAIGGLVLSLILFNFSSKKSKEGSKSDTSMPVISEVYEAKIESNLAFKIEEIEITSPQLPDLELDKADSLSAFQLAPDQAKELLSTSAIHFESEGRIHSISDDKDLPPDVNRMNQLFQPYPPILPIVETVSYSGRVDWLTGRAAYLGDYASYYQTSKHFISRSLHGMGSYLSDIVSKGDRFNVYRKGKEIEFHLVLDLSRLKLWLYCYDKTSDSRILLRSYPVCAGQLDSSRLSGSLTPLGIFALGKDAAINAPGVIGNFKNETRELITVFGVRWIPLGREIENCTGSSKGLGLHGVPWKRHPETGELSENRECIGKYESGGCISLFTEDIEELYAAIISKPAYIHIVRDFTESRLPGRETVQ